MLALLGCVSSLDLGRATTLAPGETRWSVTGEGSLIGQELAPENPNQVPWGQVGAGWHTGVSERLEVGARVSGFGIPGYFSTFGVSGDSKIQVVRGGTDIAVGLDATYYRPSLGGAPWHLGALVLPIFFGWDVGRGQIVASPRGSVWVAGSYGQEPIVVPGAQVGLAWVIAAGPIELTPELVGGYAGVGFDGTVHDPDRTGAWALEGGMSIGWRTGRRP